MDYTGQSVRPVDGICDSCAPLRTEPLSRPSAQLSSRRLERRFCPSWHGIRAFELSRQYCCSAHRRHGRPPRFQFEGPHRLYRRNRRCGERRRLLERNRRHDHNHDVDRRHQPPGGVRSHHRRDYFIRHFGNHRGAPATALFPDRQTRSGGPSAQYNAARCRGDHPCHGCISQCGEQPLFSNVAGQRAGFGPRRLAGDSRDSAHLPAGLECHSGSGEGFDLLAGACPLRLDDAGRAPAGCILANGYGRRFPFRDLRQYSAHRPGAETRWL